MSKTEKPPRLTSETSGPQSQSIEVIKNNGDYLAKFQVGLSIKSPFGPSVIEPEFGAADATERALATLSVGLQNATMQSLENAAYTAVPDVRNEEMRNAIRAAKAVAELLEALDRHRGRGKQSVAVGQVNVESGGQAIVGNVNTEARPSIKPEEPDKPADNPLSQENTVTPRGTRKVGSR